MSDDGLRRLFDTVLTEPPRDTIDIGAAIRAGRRRRQGRTAAVVLSSAAALATAGIAAATYLPSSPGQSASPPTSGATARPPVTANEGTTVTSADQILGSWTTIELYGRDVRGRRDNGLPGVRFQRSGTQLRWGADDGLNYLAGPLSISKEGRFSAKLGTSTFVGLTTGEPRYRQNPEAVQQATQARIVAATPTSPRTLQLVSRGRVLAVYTSAPATPTAAATTPGR